MNFYGTHCTAESFLNASFLTRLFHPILIYARMYVRANLFRGNLWPLIKWNTSTNYGQGDDRVYVTRIVGKINLRLCLATRDHFRRL